MRIDLTRDQVLQYSRKYVYGGDELLASNLQEAWRRGYLTRADLIAVAKWKWRGGRTRQLAAENAEEEVQEITRASFAAKSERLRIGSLLALRGVNWPMASVILHFAHADRYPILDRRAMSTSDGSTIYTFERWLSFTELCRLKANELSVSMHVLDRALWAMDKEKNSRASSP